jgi:ABC-2 type transport system ATP-binding protein
MSLPIQLTDVSKRFGDLVAVSDVSFDVGPGVTALLGPNGAGKSTVLRLAAGLAVPSKGTVRLFGADPRSDIDLARRIGLVPQQETLFESQTAGQFVGLAARLQGVDEPNRAAHRALETVEMDPDETRPLSTYSKGMRQRVKLAQALVHDPDIVVLDEPLTGLDPRQRLHMIKLFHDLGETGKCILVSSHVLDEVARIGSRVLVIAQGRLVAEGDFHEIRALMDDRPLRIRVGTNRPRELARGLLELDPVVGVSLTDSGVEVDAVDARVVGAAVARIARDHDASLDELEPLDDDLEAVFKYLVSRK